MDLTQQQDRLMDNGNHSATSPYTGHNIRSPYFQFEKSSEFEHSINFMQFTFRYWKLIVSTVAICSIVSGITFIFTPRLYESRAKVIIGQTGNLSTKGAGGPEATAVEEIQSVHLKLKDARYQPTTNETDPKTAFVKELKIQEKAIEILALGSSPEFSQSFLNNLLQEIMRDHNQMIEDWRTIQRKEIANLDSQIKGLLKVSDSYTAQVNSSGIKSDQKFIYTIDRQNLLARIDSLQAELEKKNAMLLGIYTKPTVLLSKPSLNTTPYKPRLPLYLSIGIFFGLALGYCMAAFRYQHELSKIHSPSK